MNILILGVNGMAGHMMAIYLHEAGHSITGFSRQEEKLMKSQGICKYVLGDATDKVCIKQAVTSEEFDVIINCVGVLNQAVDEKLADGIYLNSVLPHYIAECIQGRKTKLIHISTDCVFSGDQGRYKESSSPDAMSFYGRSKALGEIQDKTNLTFRTSIVGPEIKKNGIGLFHWFMNQSDNVAGFTKAIWSGVTTLELAKAVEQVIQQEVTGLYHLVNNEFINKYDLLCLFNEYVRRGEVDMRENDAFISDKSLINTRTDFQYEVPAYETMVKELAVWMKKHKMWYEQYRLHMWNDDEKGMVQ